MNKKLISNDEKLKPLMTQNEDEPHIKNKYKKLKIKNKAPNWVQKNIKYAASTQRLVLANLYKIKKDGIRSIS